MDIIKNDLTDIMKVFESPADYPVEQVANAYDRLKQVTRIIYETKKRVEGHIISEMKKDNATKMNIIGADGEQKVITLKAGQMKASERADETYAKAGFPVDEIGSYVFKSSWSKAKQARKHGGEKQKVIDKIFKAGEQGLTIKEA